MIFRRALEELNMVQWFPPCRSWSCGVILSRSVLSQSVAAAAARFLVVPVRLRPRRPGATLSSGCTRSTQVAGFHSSTRSIAPWTSTSFSNLAKSAVEPGSPCAPDDRSPPRASSPPTAGPDCDGPVPTSARSRIAVICRSNSPGVHGARQPSVLLGQVPAPLESGAELRRQDHPALGVERVLVPPYKACHWLDLPRRSLDCVL